MSNTGSISEVLNMTPLQEDKRKLPTIINPQSDVEDDKQLEQDLRDTRTNILEVLEHGREAFLNLVHLADQSQHPRSYEVVAKLLTALTNANKDVVDLHEKKHKLLKKDKEEERGDVVNNNLFVGSTAELQKLISRMKNDS